METKTKKALMIVTYLIFMVFPAHSPSLAEDVPTIGFVGTFPSVLNGGANSAFIRAGGVTNADSVWAVIMPPQCTDSECPDPLADDSGFPKIRLMGTGEGPYGETFGEFFYPGTYRISVYAENTAGYKSQPREIRTTQNHDNMWPAVGTVSSIPSVLEGGADATIRVEDITNADSVFAVIMPPDYIGSPPADLPKIELTDKGNGQYEGTYTDFSIFGTYRMVAYAKDTGSGNISFPEMIQFDQLGGADIYEDDDSFEQARYIEVEGDIERHNIDSAGDEDWVKFYAVSGIPYEIRGINLDENCDIVIELYDADQNLLWDQDTTVGDLNADETLSWSCRDGKDGYYYVKYKHYEENAGGSYTGYDIQIIRSIGPASDVPNDYFSKALMLAEPSGQIAASNLYAVCGSDPWGEPYHAGITQGKSLWWIWIPPKNCNISFNTYGSDFDTIVAVYTCCSEIGSLIEVASNDDGISGITSEVTFQAQEGERYYIAVTGKNEESGNIVLNWMSSELKQEAYKFERMWPTLQQPWYFTCPRNIATDTKGFIYVTDSGNSRIQKLTADGQFVVKWGAYGSGSGEFDHPAGIALDAGDFIYIADTGNDRIQKFAPDGQFISKWGNYGTGEGEFNYPVGIALDGDGFFYIADSGNDRIQKFTSDGQFVAEWGNYGGGVGEFNYPVGIASGIDGFVYVADTGNDRIQKFTSDGDFVSEWGNEGSNGGQFRGPSGIALDADGNICVVDSENYRIQKFAPNGEFIAEWGSENNGAAQFLYPFGIASDAGGYFYIADISNDSIQKFSSDGQFVTRWGSKGSKDDQFQYPDGAASDHEGFVYFADTDNHCIRKFSPDGRFITKWGSKGSEDGLFLYPDDLTIDTEGFVYVADTGNNCIQKFASQGQFEAKWGTCGSGDGQFRGPSGVASDADNFIYVLDTGNNRIQKFASDGKFVAQWGRRGITEGQFMSPLGIAADISGFVYVADTENNRIQKFTEDGKFLSIWGTYGMEDGKLAEPEGIAIDNDGYVYVTDTRNCRVQKFTEDGMLVSKFGGFGSDPAQLNNPVSLCTSPDKKVYISDASNQRIQVFKPALPTDKKMKALIVAGGGPDEYSGGMLRKNSLWDATQLSANFAYRALTYQGFTKESIYYLTSDTELDLDNNGEPDDVDGDATKANLEKGITQWAAQDADSLVVYITDHGGHGTFRMSRDENLSASALDLWLDTLQTATGCEVIVVYDACNSGSFVSELTPPGDAKRIVITSTKADEPAHFIRDGYISFSTAFWAYVFNGFDIRDAFEFSVRTMGSPEEFQHPLIDANGDGSPSDPEDLDLVRNLYIGNGTRIQAESPEVEDVSQDQTIDGTNSALLYASGVTDADGISRVWAIIRPPDYDSLLAASDSPVTGLPSVTLNPVGNDRYENTYDGFYIEGTYQIAIYAMDGAGNTMAPRLTTVTAVNPLGRKAIIVAGGAQSDALWGATEKNARIAYDALKFQRYTDENIYFMSAATFSEAVRCLPAVSSLRYAVNDWAAKQTWDLVLYLVGDTKAGDFRINDTEVLKSADLDNWLDALQAVIPGGVTVICDAYGSGNFLSPVTAPEGKERILISSTSGNQAAAFMGTGLISFSRYFWESVLCGNTVRDAFTVAQGAMKYLSQFGIAQDPGLDDSGNGITNEKYKDGNIAKNRVIGLGIMLAGNAPAIGSVSPAQTLNSETSAGIRAEGITAAGAIESVTAVIIPPSPDLPANAVSLELNYDGNTGYEGIYSGFSQAGTYQVLVYATDEYGNISHPAVTQVEQTAASNEPVMTLEVSISADTPANLTLYDSENRGCGKEGCDIPGAVFNTQETGEQVVSVSEFSEGDWRAVLHGKDDGAAYLTLRIYQGDTEIFSETKTAAIGAHEAIRSEISLFSDLTFTASDPQLPVTAEGDPLYYDFDGDNDIDDEDIERVRGIWNTCEGDPGYERAYDLKEDGCINILDITPVVNSKYVP